MRSLFANIMYKYWTIWQRLMGCDAMHYDRQVYTYFSEWPACSKFGVEDWGRRFLTILLPVYRTARRHSHVSEFSPSGVSRKFVSERDARKMWLLAPSLWKVSFGSLSVNMPQTYLCPLWHPLFCWISRKQCLFFPLRSWDCHWAAIAHSYSLRAGRFGDRVSVKARFSATAHTGPRAHPASYTIGYRLSSLGQGGRGVALTTHLHLALRLKKE